MPVIMLYMFYSLHAPSITFHFHFTGSHSVAVIAYKLDVTRATRLSATYFTLLIIRRTHYNSHSRSCLYFISCFHRYVVHNHPETNNTEICDSCVLLCANAGVERCCCCCYIWSPPLQTTAARYRKNNSWHLLPYNNTVVVHPLDGEIYALIINFSSSYEVRWFVNRWRKSNYKTCLVFVILNVRFFTVVLSWCHGGAGHLKTAQHILWIWLYNSRVGRTWDYCQRGCQSVSNLQLTIIAHTSLSLLFYYSLRVSQRKCRYTNEDEIMRWNPIYSFGLCRMECRMRFSLKYCGCIPHFYRDRG